MSVFATTNDSAFAAVMAHIERRDRLLAEVRPANKTAVFDALAAAGSRITTARAAYAANRRCPSTRRSRRQPSLPKTSSSLSSAILRTMPSEHGC